MNNSRIALSFDVGGTFTDFVIVNLDSGEVIQRHKVLTSSGAPAAGVLPGWSELLATDAFAPADV